MGKQAISVTLASENITWLKGRLGSTGRRSLSELIDQIVTAARTGGTHGPVRSVVGTIDVDPRDPELNHADDAIRALFDESIGRPLMIKESKPTSGRTPRKKARRG
jgi:hypothetical protein